MPIDLPDGPVTIEAVPETTADKLWILSLAIQAPSTQTEAQIDLRYCPWTGSPADEALQRDRAGSDITTLLTLPDLYRSRAECPELNEVFLTIVNNLPAIVAYKKKRDEGEAKEKEQQ